MLVKWNLRNKFSWRVNTGSRTLDSGYLARFSQEQSLWELIISGHTYAQILFLLQVVGCQRQTFLEKKLPKCWQTYQNKCVNTVLPVSNSSTLKRQCKATQPESTLVQNPDIFFSASKYYRQPGDSGPCFQSHHSGASGLIYKVKVMATQRNTVSKNQREKRKYTSHNIDTHIVINR